MELAKHQKVLQVKAEGMLALFCVEQ